MGTEINDAVSVAKVIGLYSSKSIDKDFVEKPEYWKYSSARNYILGDDSLIKLDTDKLS